MSPTKIDWSVSTVGADTTLALWGQRLRNPQPAFNEMADVLALLQKDWFRTEGEGTWAPLSEPYRTWKKKRFPKRGILHGPDRPGHRGLQLRDQLTKRPFGYEKITRAELVIGSTLPYARYHQLGEGVPKRVPLKPITPETVRILQKIIQVHVVGEAMGGF